ncbi:hypothetical protein BJX65DRAFT_312487 [Aspergillus insuetus]
MEPQGEPLSGAHLTGCIVCRSRKVRCDKKLPFCRNCARLGVPCPGYSTDDRALSRKEIVTSTEKIFRAAGKQRRRMGACEACRASKEHCTRAKPACQRCLLRKIPCVYRAVEKKTPRPPAQSESSPYSTGPVLAVAGFQVDLAELYSSTLPEGDTLQCLVNTYFDRAQPMGYTGIIHKPSFMQALDRGTAVNDFGEPTLHIICALGARQIALSSMPSLCRGAAHASTPGDAWAEKARQHVLLTAHIPTTQDLVAMILVCEYASRTNQHALIFCLSGCLFRAICLLGLDTPHQPTAETQAEVLSQETANRIVWASYHIDSLTAPGVDKHSSWRDDYPRIPLPRSDQDFLALSPGTLASLNTFDSSEDLSTIKALDIPALTTVLFRLRRTVLRIIRTTPDETPPIWSPLSPFSATLLKLDSFFNGIPDRYHLTDLNMYMHRDQHILNAVFHFYLLFHAAMFDLTRISIPGFSFPLATAFRGAPPVFLQDCQRRCFHHAHVVSNLVRKVLPHKGLIVDQPLWSGVLFESAKIQIVFTATVQNDTHTREMVRQNLRANLDLLEFLHTGKEEQSPCVRVILSLCMLFGLEDITREFNGTFLLDYFPQVTGSTAEMLMTPRDPDESTYVTGSPDMHHLTNFAFFRRARAEIQARQTNVGITKTSSCESSRLATVTPLLNPAYGAEKTIQRDESRPQASVQDSQSASHSLSHVQELEASLPSPYLPAESQPSVEDYIRTAEEMGDYLAWTSMDALPSLEWPPWETIDPSGLRSG